MEVEPSVWSGARALLCEICALEVLCVEYMHVLLRMLLDLICMLLGLNPPDGSLPLIQSYMYVSCVPTLLLVLPYTMLLH
jgi:hypothetical protein